MMEWPGWLALAACTGLLVMAPLLAWALVRASRAEATARDALGRVGTLQTHYDTLRRILDQPRDSKHGPKDAFGVAIQDLDSRLARLEGSAPLPSWPATRRPEPLRPAHMASPTPARPVGDVERLTADAAAALRSPDSFRAFAAAAGGNGLVLRKDEDGTDPAPSPDVADLWQVEHGGAWLVFPGFGLARRQALLLGDAGRAAQDSLGWLFEIQRGDQFKAALPAKLSHDGTVKERGVLVLPG